MTIFADIITTPRGCGKRQKGGLYACTGLSTGVGGVPIEAFVIDPPIPWTSGPFRGVQFVERANGPVDIVMWVGAENYPTVPDYIEEARQMGFCKRIPTGTLDEGNRSNGVDYNRIVPHESRMVLVHPKAVVHSAYRLSTGTGSTPNIQRTQHGLCAYSGRFSVVGTTQNDHHLTHDNEGPSCTFATWDLSALESSTKHRVEPVDSVGAIATISTPSVSYHASYPKDGTADPVEYSPGIFCAVPLGHFEFISATGDTMPEPIADLLGANFIHTKICDE